MNHRQGQTSESKAKYEEALKKLRDSGLQVEDRTEDGSMFGFIGGVRPPSSVPAQDQNNADSRAVN
jgi:hypothetical protein